MESILKQYKSKKYWKGIAIPFLIYFIIHGAVQYLFKEKDEVFSLNNLGSTAIFALWMAFFFSGMNKIKTKVEEIQNRNLSYYIELFVFAGVIYSVMLFMVMFIGYLFFKVFTEHQIEFGKTAGKSILVLLCTIFLLTLIQFFYDRFKSRIARKVH